jgi:hypothetical protein
MAADYQFLRVAPQVDRSKMQKVQILPLEFSATVFFRMRATRDLVGYGQPAKTTNFSVTF